MLKKPGPKEEVEMLSNESLLVLVVIAYFVLRDN